MSPEFVAKYREHAPHVQQWGKYIVKARGRTPFAVPFTKVLREADELAYRDATFPASEAARAALSLAGELEYPTLSCADAVLAMEAAGDFRLTEAGDLMLPKQEKVLTVATSAASMVVGAARAVLNAR